MTGLTPAAAAADWSAICLSPIGGQVLLLRIDMHKLVTTETSTRAKPLAVELLKAEDNAPKTEHRRGVSLRDDGEIQS